MKRFLNKSLSALLVFVIVFGTFTFNTSVASAAVTNIGVGFFGDNSATAQGVLRYKNLTASPATWSAQANGAAASSVSFSNWIVAKSASTREEMMIGQLRVNGTLDIQTCTTGCDAVGDYTARWNNPGTSATQTCSAATGGGCVRPFDIGYETLSGQAIVAYGDTTAGKFYYAIWDGSAWSPNTTPGTPGATNEVALSSGTAVPRWIRVVPAGDILADSRANRTIILVGSSVNAADTAYRLDAFYFDGTTMGSASNLSTTLENCELGLCFDGNWQGNTNFIAVYSKTAVNEIRYQKYIVGTGWGGDLLAAATASLPIFINTASDPTSSRIMVTTASAGNDTRSAVWRADNATDGWTLCNGTCPDTTTETVGGNQAYPAFERYNGEALHIYNDAGTLSNTTYWTYTPTSTWGTKTASGLTTTDDDLMVKAWTAPNSDDIMTIVEDVDCRLRTQLWTGAAYDTTITELNNGTTATISNYSATCPLSTTPAVAPVGIAFGYDFAWKMYSPWARNWRFYNGTDSADPPTTALAAENTTPTGFDASAGKARLRYTVQELAAGGSQTDSRKKLQYTTDSPDSLTSTWTDVDNAAGAGIWRYVDCNSGTGTCDDNTALTSTVLSGTPTVGWSTLSKDAAGGTNMDHSASQLKELEYSIEANGAVGATTYYFRMFDVDQLTPVFREQDNDGSNDCAIAVCTYPSLTTQAIVAPTVSTDFASNVKATSGTVSGTKTGGDNATQHGFAWGTNSGLNGGDTATTTLGAKTTNTTFSSGLSLTANTTYYFRAYATNSGGTGYGVIRSFFSGNSTVTRKMLLFEGSRIKLLNNKMILHQQ